MRNGIVLLRSGLMVFFTIAAMAGYGDTGTTVPGMSAGRVDRQMRSHAMTARDALRIREDPLRNRLWVLTLNEVRVYETARTTKQLIRRIPLPNWSVVGFRYVCMPDMVLDRSVSAFVSSNGQARLLRIDAESFNLKNYDINFHESAGRDSGFGALAFAADGALFARTTVDGRLWIIDINKARAIMVEVDKKLPVDECVITTQLLNDLERSPTR